MDIVQLAIDRELGHNKSTWEVELITGTKLVGTITSLGREAYVLDDGMPKYFTADRVVRINLY